VAKVKSYVEGPKWAGLKQVLFQLAIYYNLDLVIIDHDKGWIGETIYFSVEGESENIKGMNRALKKSIEEYNK
jgi:hypothetical protein